jgi:hypothetical protein
MDQWSSVSGKETLTQPSLKRHMDISLHHSYESEPAEDSSDILA